jgi:quercetin dioxygenase-like cupin family protein
VDMNARRVLILEINLMTQAINEILIENDKVRVSRWTFPPGTETGQHLHELAYIVVPTTTGTLVIRDSQGQRDNNLVAGSPYYRDAGVEHNVFNEDSSEMSFIEIELK